MKRRVLPLRAVFLAFSLLGLVLTSCKDKASPQPAKIPEVGHIQVLNASGAKGAAQDMAALLRGKGFDVVEVGNYDEWYFPHTIVASRSTEMRIAKQVAASLQTDRVLLLRQEGVMLDATVFVGRDFTEKNADKL